MIIPNKNGHIAFLLLQLIVLYFLYKHLHTKVGFPLFKPTCLLYFDFCYRYSPKVVSSPYRLGGSQIDNTYIIHKGWMQIL